MRKTVLAVDDDALIHELLSFSLEEEGIYNLESVLSAFAAQDYLKEHYDNVDAIVLDWQMPKMSGIEFLTWLKEQEDYKDIPVIMLTGNNKKEDIKAGIDAGAVYYLTKPFNRELLESILSAAINDYVQLKELSQRVKNTHNPLTNLQEGVFKIRTLEDAVQLSVIISNVCPDPQEAIMVSEILNNAIEHGNLGITYDEKSQLLDDSMLTEEIIKRLNSPEYGSRYATVNYLREIDELVITIEDQGEGFDFTKYLEFDIDRVFENHGRGIAMANSMLHVKYLGKGNKVEVKIPLKSLASS